MVMIMVGEERETDRVMMIDDESVAGFPLKYLIQQERGVLTFCPRLRGSFLLEPAAQTV